MRPIIRWTHICWLLLLLGCSAATDPENELDGSDGQPTSEETTPTDEEPTSEVGDDNEDTTDNNGTTPDPWDAVATFIEQKRAEANIPGLAVAVTRPGEVVWTGAFGMANLETEVAVTVDTPFMLASVSKTVTAVTVMRAELDNHLTLDDPINLHLPFTVDNPRTDGEVITLRHLVSHTSGIRDNWSQMPYADGDSPYTLGSYLEGYLVDGGNWYNATENFYNYMPGTTNNYGNIATALAGYVVESATDIPFDDYSQEKILNELNMNHSGWHLEDFDPATVAMPYEYTNGQHEAVGHFGYPDYPDGQLRSSVSDMARFLAAISNQGQLGESAVLSPQGTADMLAPQFPDVDSSQFVFWYASNVASRSVVGHGGSDQGVATEMVFSPESGVGVIFMINTTWDVAGSAPGAIMEALFNQAENN
jgi:CubicO group peptidase (beta-lactamase class C family)